MTPRSIILVLATVALLALAVSAYPQDLQGMPNGASFGINLGHPGGATKRTTGIANGFYGAGKKWSKAFCQADSDGDGQSNGLEMGDPCCVWTKGAAPMFTDNLSNPNSAADMTTNEMPNCAALAAEFQAAAVQRSAVRPMQFEVAQDKQPCDACIAKLTAKDVPADDAAKICKLLQCVPAAAPAPKVAMAAAAKVPCDKCIAELTEKFVPADDAAEICMKVLKCQPAAVPTAAPKATTAVPKATTAAPKQAMVATESSSASASESLVMLRAKLAGTAQCNCNCNGQDHFAAVSSCQQCSVAFCQANFCQGAGAIASACAA